MKDETAKFVIGLLIGILFTFFFFLGYIERHFTPNSRLVRDGYAHYDTQTAKFIYHSKDTK